MACQKRAGLLTIVVAAVLGPMLGLSQAKATTYSFDYSSIGVSGSITTDGHTGTLSAGDITSWEVDSVHGDIDPTNSGFTLSGASLSATATGLYFDFSLSDGSVLNFSRTNLGIGSNNGGNGGINLQYCDSNGACINQVSASSFSMILSDWVAPGCCSSSGGIAESGKTLIAGTEAAVTPLPAALPLFATGLGAMGLLGWRRKRKGAAGNAA